jgi:hypothetical protein
MRPDAIQLVEKRAAAARMREAETWIEQVKARKKGKST